jgi:DNA repair protein RadC
MFLKKGLINQAPTIRDLPSDERPRERLLKYGVESLSLQELLSLIFGRGIRKELLTTFNSLKKLSEASIEDFKKIAEIGLARACQLKACFEIARRLKTEEKLNKNKTKIINSPKDIYRQLKEKIIDPYKEYFIVVSLDNRNKTISINTVSIGILNSSLIHPRETFGIAIKNHAASIILCHNHPSGELKPSRDDLIITENLIKAGKILGIEIFDHIIITKKKYFSFAENNLLI